MSQKYTIGTQFKWKPGLARFRNAPKCVNHTIDGHYRLLWPNSDGTTFENTWTESDIDYELVSDYTPLEHFVRNKLSSMGIKINA